MALTKVLKSISHVPQKVLQRMGMADETVDKDFNQKADAIKKLDETVKKLIKDITAYYSSIDLFGKSTEEIGASFDSFYNNDTSNRFAGLQQVLHNLHDEWTKDRDAAIQELAEYQKEIKEFREQINDRNDKLLEYDTTRKKLESVTEKKKKKVLKKQKIQ